MECFIDETLLQESIHEQENDLEKTDGTKEEKKEPSWKDKIKADRQTLFSTFDLVYKSFEKLGYNTKEPDFFLSNASEFIDKMREECWKKFREQEKQFTSSKLKEIFASCNNTNLDLDKCVESVCENRLEDFYTLFLSNTQSRRSRAGNEFEAIIELLLLGADIPFETQVAIETTNNSKLKKNIDFVIPSAILFNKLKRESVIMSAKTTLRERWQEVTDEIVKTGAPNIYLITLDTEISGSTYKSLDGSNIIFTTTKSNKESIIRPLNEHLEDINTRISNLSDKAIKKRADLNKKKKDIEDKISVIKGNLVTFERLLEKLKQQVKNCRDNDDLITISDIKTLKSNIQKQIDLHKNHSFIQEKLKKRMNEISDLENKKKGI